MRILVACEESQAVTTELVKLGHNAYSCDIQPCGGDMPHRHIQGDVVPLLAQEWDMIIAHPPCTYLSNAGVSWLVGRNAKPGRWYQLNESAAFFRLFLDHPCPRIAVENPIMHKYGVNRVGRKHDCLVQPYHFGHMESKATCFWLKGLPPLLPTDNVREATMQLSYKDRNKRHYLSPGPDRAKLRSRTYTGMAKAMAWQWAGQVQ